MCECRGKASRRNGASKGPTAIHLPIKGQRAEGPVFLESFGPAVPWLHGSCHPSNIRCYASNIRRVEILL